MPKDEPLEYFYGIDKRMEEAFSDSVGRINAMKIGLSPKKPDKSKVKVLLEKEKRPDGGPAKAQYFLSLDGLKLSFELRIGKQKIVLNKLDIGAVEDRAKQRQLLFNISLRSHIVSEKDLAEFDKKFADPGEENETVEINQQIDRLNNGLDNLRIMQSSNYRRTKWDEVKYTYSREFREWAESKRFDRFVAFAENVDNGHPLSDKARDIFKDQKSSGMKPQTFIALQEAWEKGEKPDYKTGRNEVVKNVIERILIPSFNKEKLAALQKDIDESNRKVKELQAKLKALKAN